MSPALSHKQAGRLAPGSFALFIVAVYLVSFASQMLLSAPVTARAGVLPFALVQAALVWLWIDLHRRRLRDAGRPAATAIGVAMIYALEVVLLTLIVWMMASASGAAHDDASIFHLFVLLSLLGAMAGDPHLGDLKMWLAAFAVLMLLPVLIALGFSLWTATRPTAPPAP